MGQSVFPVPSSGVAQYAQAFTSSSTWTAPTSSTYNGIATVTVVGAGGGGGSGGGGSAFASDIAADQYCWGGAGGGGGGGGQVIYQQQYLVPAGTAVPVTVGAGGSGGQTNTTPQIYNYIINPLIGSSNITGYTNVANTVLSRVTTPLPTNNLTGTQSAALAVQMNSTTGNAFRYDTGNNAFTVPTGNGERGYTFSAAIASGNTSANLSFVLSFSWYANATLIRTDTTSTLSITTNGTANTYNTEARTNFNNNPAFAIPSNATRLVIDWSAGAIASSGTTFYFTQMQLTPYDFVATHQSGGNSNTRYIDPSSYNSFVNATTKPLYWAGTAWASPMMVPGGAGVGLNSGSSYTFNESNTPAVLGAGGKEGSAGGNSSFGSYVTAYGGGYGGAAANQSSNPRLNGGASYGGNFFRGRQPYLSAGGPGGNGGGGGNKTGWSSVGGARQMGSGGGGGGGWENLTLSSVNNTYQVSPQLWLTGGKGIQFNGADGGSPYGKTDPSQAASGAPIAGAAGYGYTPTIGGKNLYGFGAGGDGGAEGFASFTKSQTGAGPSTYNLYQNQIGGNGIPVDKALGITWPSTPAGAGGSSAYPSSGGAGGNATAGSNGVNFGDGGAGGSGGGSSTTTTLNGTTMANPGNGSNGGNGANGIVIVTWSA